MTAGFILAIAMWCAWFLTHLPGLDLAPAWVGAGILASMVLAGVLVGRGLPRAQPVLVIGAAAGFVASCINLLVLGSYLTSAAPVDPNAADAASHTTLHPSTMLIVVGFLAAGTIAGALALSIGAALRGEQRRSEQPVPADWHARFAAVTAIAIVPLLLIGGLVTGTGSGLAVPDWPATYSANMFMYPIGLMTRPRIFLEHSHRLFGTLVGLTTLVLMLYAVLTRRPAFVKRWAVGLFLLVVAQGVLGGLRVTEKDSTLAMIHGVSAQLFLALTVAYATVVSPLFRGVSGTQPNTPAFAPTEAPAVFASPDAAAVHVRRLKVLAAAATHSLVLQLIFGAMYRHLRAPHALWSHIGFSIVVALAAACAGFLAMRLRLEVLNPALRRTLARLGAALSGAVLLQFVLGWIVFWVVQEAPRAVVPFEQATTAAQVPAYAAIITTLHQANGAFLLCVATMTYAWSIRFKRIAR